MHNFKLNCKGQTSNLEQLKRQKEIVEDAIQHLNVGKQQVEDYITKTKQEVEFGVNSIYSQLRQREIQLLRQIDVFSLHYWSRFETQNAKLHQMLGILTQALSNQSVDVSFSKQEIQLVEEVCQQQFLRNSVMSYEGNVDDVCQQLQKFGKLSTNNYFDLSSTDEHLKSQCMPNKLEEYDDPDHQLLYKTLHELQLTRLSDEEQDWLRQTAVNVNENKFQLPDHFENEDLSYWLRDSCTKKSLEDEEDLKNRFEIMERLSLSEYDDSIELLSVCSYGSSSSQRQSTKMCGGCCDIENIGDAVMCDSPCNDYINKWLSKGSSDSLNQFLKSQNMNLKEICMANECCSDFEQCVCKQRCATKAFQKMSPQQQTQWLKSSSKDECLSEKSDFSEKNPTNYFLRESSRISSDNFQCPKLQSESNGNWLNSDIDLSTDRSFIRKDFQTYFNSSRDTDWLN